VGEAIELSEGEMTALSEIALGSPADTTSGPLAALVKRGLATVKGGEFAFSEALQAAFEAMSTCTLNLTLMTDAGSPDEQFYVGEEGSASRAFGNKAGLTVQRLDLVEIPNAVVAGLNRVLAASTGADLPNADTFAEIGAALDMEGLQARAWCGIVASRPAPEGQEGGDENSWLLVVRCDNGCVWQDPQHGVLAFAETDEDLADLVTALIA